MIRRTAEAASELNARIGSLLEEVEVLRAASRDKEDLMELVNQLRDVNQNLVLAAVNAQNLKDEAEAANRRQNDFLAMLAHELRNPLAPISMSASLLERLAHAHPDLPKLQTIISRQAEHMARLLDDLLDAARISSGKIALERKSAALSEVLERAIETCQPAMIQRRQQFILDLPQNAINLECDPVRLAQVFSNLLVNASKFTPERGRIALSAKCVDGQVAVSIEDNGAGIPADVLPHVFDLFIQGPRSLARSEGGLGIGLSIVRSLVQMHGGSVEAHSEGPGRGSIFKVILPLGAAQCVEHTEPQKSIVSGNRRVLLVEDNPDASDTLGLFLQLEGYSVDFAYDGITGLAMARQGIYDAIVCDIGLPGMDGLTFMKELRRTQPDIPTAIALSGYGQPEDRVRAHEAGFNHYLVKPADTNKLISFVAASGRA